MSWSFVRRRYGDDSMFEKRDRLQQAVDVDGRTGCIGSDSLEASAECGAATTCLARDSGVQYIIIYESELRVMAGVSAEWGEQETAGSLFGLWTQGGRPAVFLVTGPGPKAIHSSVHCQHDVEFFHAIRDIIEPSTGLQHAGDWHGHHYLGLERPSEGDLGQVKAVTSKNRCSRWCGIITTVCRSDGSDPSPHRSQRNVDSSPPGIRISAFLYLDPQAGVYVPAALHVLPGISPVRMALLSSGKLDPTAIGEQGLCFPLQGIRYMPASVDRTTSAAPPILATLAEQLRQLPESARTKIELRSSTGIVTIAAPLADNHTAYVAVNDTPPHTALAVHVKSTTDGELRDVGDTILAGNRDLRVDQVYSRLASLDKGESMPPTPTKPQLPEDTAGTGTAEKKSTRTPASKSKLQELCKRIVGRVGKKTARKAEVRTHSGKRAKGGRTGAVGS
ncbi:MAG: hypothetical protein QUV05_20145 [Phycisphaerae bacterium]|nr:hypothetical protein [Phycisphaerae bacterium]